MSWKTFSLAKVATKRRKTDAGAAVKEAIEKHLETWWTEDDEPVLMDDTASSPPREPSITPLEWVAFVDSGLRALHQIRDMYTHVPRSVWDGLSRRALYVVLYAVIGTTVHVLGGVTRNVVDASLGESGTPVILKDLLQTRRADVASLVPPQGADAGTWFRLPFAFPSPAIASDPACVVDADTVQYRMRLMTTWWANRASRDFETDSLEMLRHLHEGTDPAYFDLSSEAGRGRELASYWMLALTCAYNPALWDRWRLWERTLLEFRIARYFFTEAHFKRFIVKNEIAEYEVVDDPGEQELELYRKRNPDEAPADYPRLWILVPVHTVGRAIASSTRYDIDQGRVLITYKEFAAWAWAQMEATGTRFMKELYARRAKGLMDAAPQKNLVHCARTALTEAKILVDREEAAAADERYKRRRQMTSQSLGEDHDVALFDTGNRVSLLEMARRLLPPCMARHIWRALMHGQHPKYQARLALSMFFLEADYTVEETERVMYLLYEADEAFVGKNHPRTGWCPEAFTKEYGGQVPLLHTRIFADKRVGAFGCKTLTNDEQRDCAHGCPFAETSRSEIREFLGWAGVADIEDIMRPSHPQGRCSKYFQDRHPNGDPVAVKHPNQFFRGPSNGRKHIKIE